VLWVSLVGCTEAPEKREPAARVIAGWDNYRLGEFSLALKDFLEASATAPRGSDVCLAALYGEATLWHLRRPGEDLEKAAQLYNQVIALAPTHHLAAWSLLGLARLTAVPVDGEAPALDPQVVAYQKVVDRFPFHPAGEEAFLLQQAAKLGTRDKNMISEAMVAIQQFVKTHPQSPWRSAAYGLIVHCCTVLGLDDQRLDAAVHAWKTSEIDPANPLQDRSGVYWQIATLAEFSLGDFSMARDYYRKLIAEYPTEQKVFLAKQELKRMDALEARLKSEGVAP
jgi:tetratricopeptide (TPR) repeat protein